MPYVKTDTQDIVRDTESKALINTNNGALKAYKYKKQKAMEMNQVIQEQAELKRELSEIKGLLMQLIGQNR
jgi:K+/H+ antiporter YhaU regulatory subunit KhtT